MAAPSLKSSIIILFLDNIPDFLDTRAEFLERAGYKVLKARGPDEARALLSEAYFHLAILDVRSADENDTRDKSGLRIAEASPRTPKIILTKFPNAKDIANSLEPTPEGLPLAVKYLDKRDGALAMVEAAHEVVENYVKSNQALQIRWPPHVDQRSFAQLTCLIMDAGDIAYLPYRIYEIEDLFRKLFYDYEQITLARLLWHKEGRAAIEVFAYTQGREEAFTVTFGAYERIMAERENYTWVPPSHSLIKLKAETMRFAANAAIVSGASLAMMQPMKVFCREHNKRPIQHGVTHLLQTSLDFWHQQRDIIEGRSLADIYREQLGLNQDELSLAMLEQKGQRLAHQAVVHGLVKAMTLSKERLALRFPGGKSEAYPNPIYFLDGDEGCAMENAATSLVCQRMPNLDLQTILVHPVSGETRLTDFGQMGAVPLGYDLIALEADIHFKLIESVNLQTLVHFERELLNAYQLGRTVTLGDVEQPYRKALYAIEAVRQQTRATFKLQQHYYTGLLLFALAGLRAYSPDERYTALEVAGFLHRLLLSALLYDAIKQSPVNEQSRTCPVLRLDEASHYVYIGERAISLPGREFELLRYLYGHAGEVCQRADIMLEVFGLQDASPRDQENLLNANISRLRGKLKRASHNCAYIETLRGVGYKLMTHPQWTSPF